MIRWQMQGILATGTSEDDPPSKIDVGDHPEHEPRDGWKRVRIRAASLNHHDLWRPRGVGLLTDRFTRVLGCDGMGELDNGSKVHLHSVMTRPTNGGETLSSELSMLSNIHDGTFAEFVVIPECLVALPNAMSNEGAACLPVPYPTTYRTLFTAGGLRPGQKVLVPGTGGGVSTATIILTRAARCWVAATSGDEHKRQQALELGAQEMFPPTERLSRRVNVVVETVGTTTWRPSLSFLEQGGELAVADASTRGRSSASSTGTCRYSKRRWERVRGSSKVSLLTVTGVQPLIDSVVPPGQGLRAFEGITTESLRGTAVLNNPT